MSPIRLLLSCLMLCHAFICFCCKTVQVECTDSRFFPGLLALLTLQGLKSQKEKKCTFNSIYMSIYPNTQSIALPTALQSMAKGAFKSRICGYICQYFILYNGTTDQTHGLCGLSIRGHHTCAVSAGESLKT